MNRKLSLILASLALVTVLAGCGNTKDNNTADTDKVPTTNDTMPTPGTDEKGDKNDAANDLQTNDAAGNTDGGNTSTTAGNASKAADDLKDGAKDIVDGAGDAVKGAGDAVADVGEAVTDAAR